MINEDAANRFMTAPWLTDVERESKLALLNTLVEERASAGAILLAQGQPNDHLTFLIDGTVELERIFSNGRKEIVTTLDRSGGVWNHVVLSAQAPDGHGPGANRRLDVDPASSCS